MDTIGLVVMGRPRLQRPLDIRPVDSNEFLERLESNNQLTTTAINDSATKVLDEASSLAEYVRKVIVIPYSEGYVNAVTKFILSRDQGTRILVTDMRKILPKPIHSTVVESARSKGILLIPLAQKALLQVDIHVALELQAELPIPSWSNKSEILTDNEQYARLKDLMRAQCTVPEIMREMGLSRSTVFRLRSRYADQLRKDIPGFQTISE